MREILFRAKRIDNGEWVEGLPQKMWGEWHIINSDDENTAYPIVPKTVSQYTGLKDKNGNRIWENDIVRTTKFGKDDGNGHNYAGFDVFVVKWDDGGFALFNKWRRFNLRTDEKSYEILGKVFDNPELLKGE